MKKRILLILLIAVLSFGTLVGCAGRGATDPGGDEAIVIGFSQRRLAGSDWWHTLVQGAMDAAEAEGVELIVLDANGETVQQNEDVHTLINRNVSAIIVNANDPIGLSSSIDAALAEDIPVIAVNCAVDTSIYERIFGYVVEDEVAGGAQGGYLLAQQFSERHPGVRSTKGIIVGGNPGDVNTENRADGYMLGWQQWNQNNPDRSIEIEWLPTLHGNWLPSDAMPLVRDAATAHPDIQVVVSLSCVMHAGIVQALHAAGLWPNIIMATYDGFQSVVKEMMDDPNDPIQVMTTNEPYSQGWDAVEMALRAIRGGAREGTVFVEISSFTAEEAYRFYDPTEVLVITRRLAQ